jgi:broad specificity phosphatase PhoE
VLACALLSAASIGSACAQDQAAAWALLQQPGHVVFMRHAEAPGYADPPGYTLEDCATQRNLVDSGRQHARRTGEAFRRNGVAFQRLLTSPWCRCKETALLAMGREAEVFAPLSNLVGRQQHTAEQVASLKAYLASLDANTRVLFVTHGIVINALTGISPASGEMIILKPGPGGAPEVAGRLRVD